MSSREEWTRKIEKLGGKVSGSVSKNTDVVIVGQNFGRNKTEGAAAKGVPTLWFPFAEDCGILSERAGPRGLVVLTDSDFSRLTITMATIMEDLYVQSRAGSPGLFFAFLRARIAIRRILNDSYGPELDPAGERDQGRYGNFR